MNGTLRTRSRLLGGLGAVKAGKTTRLSEVAKLIGAPLIEMSLLLALKYGDDVSQQQSSGVLVDDSRVRLALDEELELYPDSPWVLVVGLPRNGPQGLWMRECDLVVNFDITYRNVELRSDPRMVCTLCRRSYDSKSPSRVTNYCDDHPFFALKMRDDDRPEVVEGRYRKHYERMPHILKSLAVQGSTIIDVDANPAPSVVQRDLLLKLRAFGFEIPEEAIPSAGSVAGHGSPRSSCGNPNAAQNPWYWYGG